MNAIRFTGPLGLILFCLSAVGSAAEPAQRALEARAVPPNDAILAAIDQYVAAYNRHDAEALAAMWTEAGVYEDGQSGECLTGREAIRRDFSALLSERDDLSLSVRADRVRFIRPDVAQVTGQAITASRDESPRKSLFRALLVRKGGEWLVDSVAETLLPPTVEPYGRLRELEFLVGDWVDDRANARTTTTGRWSANRAFLVRSYTVEREDGSTHEGTQVIGWDPREDRIRCWMFDADGAFGEGIWTRSEDGWTVKYSQTLADGSRAGGTQVICRVDDETLTIQSIGQEIDGETLPASGPIRVVRVDIPAEK